MTQELRKRGADGVYRMVRTQERVRIESDVQSLELILDGSCREGKRGDGREERGRERWGGRQGTGGRRESSRSNRGEEEHSAVELEPSVTFCRVEPEP
jgi:hypothetical protein